MKLDYKDIGTRFMIGGSAVLLSYVIASSSPWKLLGGAFAAFPAVMVSAILIAGASEGTERASEIAQGATFGMIGGAFCVVATLASLTLLSSWLVSLIIGTTVWLITSLAAYRFSHFLRNNHK